MTSSGPESPPGRPPRPPDSLYELEQIRYALDQSAIVAITDVPGRIRYVNDKFCEISKYSREELLGQDHRILNSGYHSKEFMRDLWRTIANGEIWRGELRNRAKDGSLYWVDTTIVPFLDDRGKPWQYLAIRYDITSRKLNEQKLREQATLISLGEMAAVVAHEVRNPLAGIRGGIQLLSSMLPDESDGRDFIKDIVSRIDSLNAVIEDLLTFARLREPRLSRFDLSALVSDSVRSIQYDPLFAGIAFELQLSDSMQIEGDPDQLRSVFNNLLMNAAQSMPSGGVVRVEGGINGDWAVVTVTDAGTGIAPELRERVFEPFYTTKHRGTGLGLPTTKRVVEGHGGHVTLDAAPGGGTIARVELPMSSGS